MRYAALGMIQLGLATGRTALDVPADRLVSVGLPGGSEVVTTRDAAAGQLLTATAIGARPVAVLVGTASTRAYVVTQGGVGSGARAGTVVVLDPDPGCDRHV